MARRRQQARSVWQRTSETGPFRPRRRRWPGDGGPALGRPAFRSDGEEGARSTERRRGSQGGNMRSTSDAMRAIRANPLRSGLVGLAVLGTAVPMGLDRVASHADRVDPTHERTVHYSPGIDLDDAAVSEAWRESVREQTIEQQMERYAEYGVTRDVAEKIYDAAVEFDIDPAVGFGLVRAESSFRNSSTSVVGAVGLTQLMPRTAAWMVPGTSVRDLRNPDTNLAIGFKYLRYLMDKYDQNENLALLAYNRGPGTVDRALRQGADPDNGYAAFVRGEEGHGHTLFTAR